MTATFYIKFCDFCHIAQPLAGEQARDEFRSQHIHDGDGDQDE